MLAVYVGSAVSDSYCQVALLAPDFRVLSGEGRQPKETIDTQLKHARSQYTPCHRLQIKMTHAEECSQKPQSQFFPLGM